MFTQVSKSQVLRGSTDPVDPIIDNGTLLLKLDLTRGGAISYLSLSGSNRSVVNIADEGRYIQQSYYAGKSIDRKSEGQSPSWSPWAWNPIQVGDAYRNRAKILDFQKSGNSLYVKCIPMLWDMNNMPAEAEMEQWTTLSGNVLTVRNRLTCHRTDNIYEEGILDDQELPAVYPISALKNLYTYFGNAPFTNASLSNPVTVFLSSGFWGRYINDTVTENWMAYVDDNKWGIGVYNPICTNFIAGMSGQPGGEATSGATSYIAPVRKEILNKNSVYEYEYYLIVGTVDEIRTKIYQLHSSNPPITSILVRSTGEVLTLNGIGNTLQMITNVFPSVAKNLVSWSVDNSDVATIDGNGIVTALKTGTVTILATAKDGTGITGSKTITITNIPQKNAWEFNTSLEGWTSAHSGNVSFADGNMVFNITGSDPYVSGSVFTNGWIVGNLKYLWVRIKNETTDNSGALYIFFDAASGGSFTSVNFPLTPNDTDFRDFFLDLSVNPKWLPGAKISYFRLDPVNSATTGKVYVDFMRLIASKPPLVTSLTVKSAGDANEIKGTGNNLQFLASVTPSLADSTVKWSVNNPLIANIDAKGLLTAVSNGIVTVKATARDGSGIFGTKDITVSLVTSVGNLEWSPLKIFPNPATNRLTIQSGPYFVNGIVICDLLGRTVLMNNEPFIGTKTIDLALEKGTYLVRIPGIALTRKLIVN
ncbi:MAG: Ig-like domain-containing protein [Prolixibacteraceae bacterium]